MAITSITQHEPTGWRPVSINMEFKTREEYLVFIKIIGNPGLIATTISDSGQVSLPRAQIEKIIDGYAPGEVYNNIRSYLK